MLEVLNFLASKENPMANAIAFLVASAPVLLSVAYLIFKIGKATENDEERKHKLHLHEKGFRQVVVQSARGKHTVIWRKSGETDVPEGWRA